ncbi:MAG: 4Fe-4S binding protein [Anaerolineales bacterium]
MKHRDLTRVLIIKNTLTSRWPQLLARGAALGVFLLIILSGLLGTPVGNKNLSIVLVWIAWWAALILVLVPFLGRAWCSVCPLPLPGEWLQQGTLLGPQESKQGLEKGLRWPRKLRNIWLQNSMFLVMTTFSAVILIRPAVTAWLLLGLILVAAGISLLFRRRAFCRYVCPVGGFIGLYSQVAPLELRVRDPAVCRDHTQKTCITGSDEGYGCPWNVYPGGLTSNTNCGLCMECLRTCTRDNIAFNLRKMGGDLAQPRQGRLDQAFKALIMLGSALAYTAIMLGPWAGLKEAAFALGSLQWWIFIGSFLAVVLVLMPGLFYAAARLARSLSPEPGPVRETFNAYAAALIPLGLSAWAAFSLSLLFSSGSYVWPALSDPLGWGWDLFGTAGLTWSPYLSGLASTLQAGLGLVGLLGAGRSVENIRRDPRTPRESWPVHLFCFLITIGLLWLLIG